jgi:hypothetical protein
MGAGLGVEPRFDLLSELVKGNEPLRDQAGTGAAGTAAALGWMGSTRLTFSMS